MTADVGKPDATVSDDAKLPPRLWVPSDGAVSPEEEAALQSHHSGLSRRTMLKVGAVGAAGAAIVAGKAFVEPALAQKGLLSSNGVFAAAATEVANLVYIEAFPTSPLILEPFKDQLPIPKALKPTSQSEYMGWKKPPGPGDGEQNSMGNERHQIWPVQVAGRTVRVPGKATMVDVRGDDTLRVELDDRGRRRRRTRGQPGVERGDGLSARASSGRTSCR